jgi:hypothetical protein
MAVKTRVYLRRVQGQTSEDEEPDSGKAHCSCESCQRLKNHLLLTLPLKRDTIVTKLSCFAPPKLLVGIISSRCTKSLVEDTAM